MRSWTPPTPEMIDKIQASVKKEIDRQYFFSKLKNPLWVEPLRERDYFSCPPSAKYLPDGYVQYPYWPELTYLETIAEEVPDQVTDIILSMPETDNPRVYSDILGIALVLDGNNSGRLLPKITQYIELENPFMAHRFPDLIKYWVERGNISEALAITKLLLPFRRDPRSRFKRQLHQKKSNSIETVLEPTPRFDQWDYQQILENGVYFIADYAPYDLAVILIDLVADMIVLGMHSEDIENGATQDYSEIWSPKLDESDPDYQDVKASLVQTLTHACEKVFEIEPKFISELDEMLRKYHWLVFKRLRQHLYASNPTGQTLPWIREEILEHDGYHKWEYQYEFQLLIRKASEHFGSELLSPAEIKDIVKVIICGPSKDDFREWMGEQFSEDAFQKRQQYFHYMQLRPFVSLLNESQQQYLTELEAKMQTETITDDSYSSHGKATGGIVSYESPKSYEVLQNFEDEELLTYLNDWDDERREQDNWLVHITISALAEVFGSLFKDQIIPNESRHIFWLDNCDRVARPIYISAMLKAMHEHIKDRNLESLPRWLDFCTWVLAHTDKMGDEGEQKPTEESSETPYWGNSHRAVIDFIDVCVQKDTEVPINMRDGIAALLHTVCCQFDWRLDGDHPVILNHDDPIAEAINNNRSRALKSLIDFSFWVRRKLPEDRLSEMSDILLKRIAPDSEFQMTRPELALIGMRFGDICKLNLDWATEHRELFFRQEDKAVWSAAFNSYIRFNRPNTMTFGVLQHEFEFAIENLKMLVSENSARNDQINSLGYQLFTYYLWELYPLTGEGSLLERFYNKTEDKPKLWGQLFNTIGRTLRNTGGQIDEKLTARIIDFFNWRYQVANPNELCEFAFWMEAEGLDAEWRLQSYSRILDLEGVHVTDTNLYIEIRALNKLLQDNVSLVVDCFSKITDIMDQNAQMYVPADKAIPILEAGLKSDRKSVV